MTNQNAKMLSVAVAAGKVGMVYMIDGELMDWEFSSKASHSIPQMQKKIEQWINYYQPDLLVTEKIDKHSRKAKPTRALIAQLIATSEQLKTRVVTVERYSTYANKYDEIKELAMQFPQVAELAPEQPPIWMPEPKTTIYFEALSMAVKSFAPPHNLPV